MVLPSNQRLVTEEDLGQVVALRDQIAEAVSVTDGTVATILGNPASASATALSATIGGAIQAAGVGGGGPLPGLSDAAAAYLDFGTTGKLTLMGVGDSTLNDGGDGQRKLLRLLMAETPSGVGIREHLNTAGSSPEYGAPIVLRAGDGTADSGGVVFTDNFNRVVADLYGSVSSGGQTWGGAAGQWAANGSDAVGSVTGPQTLSFNVASKDMTVSATLNVITTAPASSRQIRVYADASGPNPATSGSYVWAQVFITTGGVCQLSLWKRVSGVNTQIGATINTPAGVPDNSATPVAIGVELTIDGLDASATFRVSGQTDQVIAGALDSGDVAILGTYAGFSGTRPETAMTVDSFQIETPVIPGTWRGIEWYNAAVSGQNLSYHLTHIDALAPASLHIDAAVILDGHNQGPASVDDYLSALDDYLAAFKTRHPETVIMLASENPRFAPADTITEHAARQRAFRSYAARNGYEYLPVFEAYANQDDGGAALVQSDGIHPTASTTTDTTTWCGQLLWARLVMNAITARRTVGVKPPITS